MYVAERDAEILKHIIAYCNDIEDATARFGDSLEAFQADKDYRNACVFCILQIGELSNHLSEGFKQSNKGMPWREIYGMRNIAAHHYGSMSIETVWGTIKEDIPALKEYCTSFLE